MTNKQLLCGVLGGVSGYIAYSGWGDPAMLALAAVLFALSQMVMRHKRIAAGRQITILVLAAFIGCSIPEIAKDPGFYALIILLDFLAFAGIVKLSQPLVEGGKA